MDVKEEVKQALQAEAVAMEGKARDFGIEYVKFLWHNKLFALLSMFLGYAAGYLYHAFLICK